MILLEIINLSKKFGGLAALSNVNLQMSQGEIVSLIGPNGAGKTTFFNLLTGVIQPDEGEIYFSGELITGYLPHWIVARGIARTFQNIRLFPNMTALENVMVGRHCRTRNEIFAALFRTPSFFQEENQIEKSSIETLAFVGLLPYGNELAKNLPYGDQRKLEIARALATEPRLLLLDEPTAGMNPKESQDLMDLILKIRHQGISILLIEHQMKVVMGISGRVAVLDYGIKIAEGLPKEIQNNPDVIEAYLGTSNSLSQNKNVRM